MKYPVLPLVVSVIFFVGCSSGVDTQLVEGIVLLDGSPLAEATVTIIPTSTTSGEVASGISNTSGNFTLTSQSGKGGEGALSGDYRATVSKVEITTIPSKNQDPEDARSESKELLPTIYQDAEKTPLAVAIQKGKNSIRLELKKTP